MKTKRMSRKMRRERKNMMENLRSEREHLIDENSDFFILEAYKSLRTNVIFSLAGEAGSKVVLVTSSMQSEGKSTTAVNLAISFALAEKKVLLIDCDMRRPKLARLLGMSAAAGLSNILLEPELLKEGIMPTRQKNMYVLLSGDIPPNPSELLSTNQMHMLLRDLREQFDYIIMDTPPVNVVTDAMVLSPQSDGALFVVRAGHSERNAVMRAVEQLNRANAKLLGFVLNGVEDKRSVYGKYRRNGYSKEYGYGYQETSAVME